MGVGRGRHREGILRARGGSSIVGHPININNQYSPRTRR